MTNSKIRIEHDLLGDLPVPADAYYGVQTARALENFHISGVELRLYPNLIKAFAMVKLAAARANYDCKQFSKEILKGIEGACKELIDGKLHDEFRLDVFQGGAGTSTNMNANEVIANRALELMGHKKGEYKYCDSHDHVNGSQSTNDAYPTSLHVGMALGNVELVAGDEGAHRGLPPQGQGVLEDPQDGAHAAPGRRADDARPGVRGLRRDALGRGPGARAHSERPVRDQHGGDGDRHGPERAEGLRREVHGAPGEDHGLPDPSGRRPDRGDPGHAGLRPLLLLHEEPGDQALEGLQRPAAPLLRAALRAPRDQPPGQAARLLDHARQGQPGDSRKSSTWSASGSSAAT